MSTEERRVCTEYGCEATATISGYCMPHEIEVLRRRLSDARETNGKYKQERDDAVAERDRWTKRMQRLESRIAFAMEALQNDREV